MKRLTAVYPNYPVTKELIEDWILAFDDMTYSQMVNGLVRCLREHDSGFFPSPAEFRKFCFTDRGKSAWTEKKEEMIEHDEVSEYSGRKIVPVKLPDEFKKLLGQYLNKSSINT